MENDFFVLSTTTNKENFILKIEAKYKMYYKPIIFDLAHEKRIFTAKTSEAARWVIVGYKNKLPFIKQNEPNELHISFPFIMQ